MLLLPCLDEDFVDGVKFTLFFVWGEDVRSITSLLPLPLPLPPPLRDRGVFMTGPGVPQTSQDVAWRGLWRVQRLHAQ